MWSWIATVKLGHPTCHLISAQFRRWCLEEMSPAKPGIPKSKQSCRPCNPFFISWYRRDVWSDVSGFQSPFSRWENVKPFFCDFRFVYAIVSSAHLIMKWISLKVNKNMSMSANMNCVISPRLLLAKSMNADVYGLFMGGMQWWSYLLSKTSQITQNLWPKKYLEPCIYVQNIRAVSPAPCMQ